MYLSYMFLSRYISLSDNEKTQYQARELKSVHVDAVGTFLKIVIHKNYINRHNIYNQVGIVAINVLGVESNPFGNAEVSFIIRTECGRIVADCRVVFRLSNSSN